MPARSEEHVVLITGNNGFSGRHLVDYLRNRPEPLQIAGFDLAEKGDRRVDRQFVGDLRHYADVCEAVAASRPDTIIHLAGLMPPASEAEMWAANVGAAFNLLQAVRQERLRPRIVVVGSAAEYGPAKTPAIHESHPCNPTTAYGRTKLAQTLLCQRCSTEFDLPVIVARTFNLFGPGMSTQTVIGEICAQIADVGSDRTIRLGKLTSARDFIDVRDAVSAYWSLARRGTPGEIYNVCTGRLTTVRELARLLTDIADGHYTVQSQSKRYRQGDVEQSSGDCGKLLTAIETKPQRDLIESLRDTLASFRLKTVDSNR